MKEIAKILAYLVAVFLLGALIAPPLYWAGQSLAAHGVLPVLAEFKFQKYFNRAALVAAVVLLWPTVRWLRVRGWRDLGLAPNPNRWRHLLAGFIIAAAFVMLMGAAYTGFDVYKWRETLRWEKLPKIALSAITVAVLEEALFRGAIFGLVRRTLRPYAALFWVSALFAILHFLKPDESVSITRVSWFSGFELIPHTFHQFAEPMALLAGFTTLFMLGWLLGDATLRTRSLWLSIGLHAGVVFAKMSFTTLTKQKRALIPWVGEEFQAGLVPVGVLAMVWGVIILFLFHEHRSRAATIG